MVGVLVGVGWGSTVGAAVGSSWLGENEADGTGVGLSGSYDGDCVGADVG